MAAFVWSKEAGFETLTVDGEEIEANVLGVSEDGRFLVGSMAQTDTDTVAFG